MALLDEGTLRHEVLAPGGDPDAEPEHPDPEGGREPLGVVAHPEGDPESERTEDAHHHRGRGGRLGPLGVYGVGLEVRVVERCRGQRLLRVPAVFAHARSPIQKQTIRRTPTPRRSPTKPSPTGPTPPRPNPPGFEGFWIGPRT